MPGWPRYWTNPAEQGRVRAYEEANRINATPFDLTQGPLLRLALIRIAPEEHLPQFMANLSTAAQALRPLAFPVIFLFRNLADSAFGQLFHIETDRVGVTCALVFHLLLQLGRKIGIAQYGFGMDPDHACNNELQPREPYTMVGDALKLECQFGVSGFAIFVSC